ncbi:MAG: hypothetical protein IPN93_13420 [Bacteroidetes bacterium]|nr:hypothetical protein [Bacteroidota bacterium]
MKSKIVILCMFFMGSFLACKKDKTTEEQIPEGQLSKVVFKQNEGYFDFIRALPNGNILAIGTTYDSIKLGSTTYYADQRDIVFAIFDKSGNVLKSRILSLPKSQVLWTLMWPQMVVFILLFLL